MSAIPYLLLRKNGKSLRKQKQIQSMQQELIPMDAPTAKLRVLKVVPNKPATGKKLQVHPNMQVPASSLLYKLYFGKAGGTGKEVAGNEWLGLWRHSDGSSIADMRVYIEARNK